MTQPAGPTRLPLGRGEIATLIALLELQPATASLVAWRLGFEYSTAHLYCQRLTKRGMTRSRKSPRRTPLTDDERYRPGDPRVPAQGRRPYLFALTRRGEAVAVHLADACRAYAETDEPRTNGCATACSQAS